MSENTAFGNFLFTLYLMHIYAEYLPLECYLDALHHLDIANCTVG